MLAAIGLDRSQAYVTNILPWRPPGNRTPTDAEIAACIPFIERHIELAAPRVLVLVGGTAAKTLLKKTQGIMRLRGQWYSYETPHLSAPIDTRAILHPAYLLRSPAQKKGNVAGFAGDQTPSHAQRLNPLPERNWSIRWFTLCAAFNYPLTIAARLLRPSYVIYIGAKRILGIVFLAAKASEADDLRSSREFARVAQRRSQ